MEGGLDPVQVKRPDGRLEHFKYTGTKPPTVGDVIRVLVIYAVDVRQGTRSTDESPELTRTQSMRRDSKSSPRTIGSRRAGAKGSRSCSRSITSPTTPAPAPTRHPHGAPRGSTLQIYGYAAVDVAVED